MPGVLTMGGRGPGAVDKLDLAKARVCSGRGVACRNLLSHAQAISEVNGGIEQLGATKVGVAEIRSAPHLLLLDPRLPHCMELGPHNAGTLFIQAQAPQHSCPHSAPPRGPLRLDAASTTGSAGRPVAVQWSCRVKWGQADRGVGGSELERLAAGGAGEEVWEGKEDQEQQGWTRILVSLGARMVAAALPHALIFSHHNGSTGEGGGAWVKKWGGACISDSLIHAQRHRGGRWEGGNRGKEGVWRPATGTGSIGSTGSIGERNMGTAAHTCDARRFNSSGSGVVLHRAAYVTFILVDLVDPIHPLHKPAVPISGAPPLPSITLPSAPTIPATQHHHSHCTLRHHPSLLPTITYVMTICCHSILPSMPF
ncbi:unnamed protein product [Closterium sp. NIES-64]|nr:unnamed protein product [Closterium sp. NIES-64]